MDLNIVLVFANAKELQDSKIIKLYAQNVLKIQHFNMEHANAITNNK